MRVHPPNITSYRCACNHKNFPNPYWSKNSPKAPLDRFIQTKSKQGSENEQTQMNDEFTEGTEEINIKLTKTKQKKNID